MKHLILIPLFVVLALVGCDIVEQPIAPSGSGQVDTTCTEAIPLYTTRRVLLEDFSGFRCNNCPAASEVAYELDDTYNEELVVVGIHVLANFAAPIPPLDDGYFDTDFRTDAGNTYAQDLQISFLPVGAVSRKDYDGSPLLSDGAWGAAVSDIIGQPADMDVQLACFSYNTTTNTVNVTARVIALNDVAGAHNLVIYLTEDHIIDWQIDATATPVDIPDYDHRHVLRGNLNGAYGDPVITGTLAAGDTTSLSFAYTLPPNVLEPNNCALVAYVVNNDTQEVMQVVERKFVP